MTNNRTAISRIASVLDEACAEWFEKISPRLSGVTLSGNHRRFLVNRMGSTGSAWLAKLLNSHPDVFCYHEGVVSRTLPNRSYGEQDIFDLIDSLADNSMHGAYQAVGDVGSVWLGHVMHLRAFTTAILLRHPARVLNTRLAVYSPDQPYAELSSATKMCIRQLWDVDLDRLDPLNRIFLHDLCVFAFQTWAVGKGVEFFRIEDMLDPTYCRVKLARLTGVEYDRSLIEVAVKRPINQRSGAQRSIGDILRTFSRQQRDWYFLVLCDIAPMLGYDLESDVMLESQAGSAILPGTW